MHVRVVEPDGKLTLRCIDTKQTRTIKRSVPCESFFTFFAPPKPPKDDEDENVPENIEELLEADYTLGEDIKEKLIPRAVDWFTGEALQMEPMLDLDDDDIEFEDEDDEDDDDLSEDHDEDDSDEEVKSNNCPNHSYIATNCLLPQIDGPHSQKQDTAECKQS